MVSILQLCGKRYTFTQIPDDKKNVAVFIRPYGDVPTGEKRPSVAAFHGKGDLQREGGGGFEGRRRKRSGGKVGYGAAPVQKQNALILLFPETGIPGQTAGQAAG